MLFQGLYPYSAGRPRFGRRNLGREVLLGVRLRYGWLLSGMVDGLFFSLKGWNKSAQGNALGTIGRTKP